MAKELRIEVNVTLPDDMFEQAEVVAKIKPVMDELLVGLRAAAGANNVTTEASIVVPKPRGVKDEPVAPVRGAAHAAVLVREVPGHKARHDDLDAA